MGTSTLAPVSMAQSLAQSTFHGCKVAAKVAAPRAQRRAAIPRADLYPEFGTFPGGGASPIVPYDPSSKHGEREIIHGRWAMLAVTGAYSAEVGTGIPWFEAGKLCSPDDCTAVADKFPGAVAPLAPEGPGFPSFYNVLIVEIIAMGLSEAYRTGLLEPAFDEIETILKSSRSKSLSTVGLLWAPGWDVSSRRSDQGGSSCQRHCSSCRCCAREHLGPIC